MNACYMPRAKCLRPLSLGLRETLGDGGVRRPGLAVSHVVGGSRVELRKRDSRASRLLSPGRSPLATAVPDLSPTQPHVRGEGRGPECDGSTQAWSGMNPGV